MRAETTEQAAPPADAETTRNNSLNDLAGGLAPNYQSQTIAQPFTFSEGMAYVPFTLNRIALSYGYMSYGLVQTVIDQPVEDAFRGGIDIESKELDDADIKEVLRSMEEHGDLAAIKNTAKWARLYGGAGLIIVTNQNPNTPLNVERIKKGSELSFIAADRWELILTALSISGNQYGVAGWQQNIDAPFNYYGVNLDATRAIRMLGREAPSFIRQRLQGWGMSELERCMREINTYIKLQNMVFELVDEAKIDVYKMQELNNSLASAQGTAAVQTRIQLANLIKNYRNALVMDKEDEYEQKQIAFGGLADILMDARINLCAALKIPYNKLFGESATGLGGGEDSMENYNSMVDTDVRDHVRPLVREAISLRMRAVFGYLPEFTWKFKPLRVLNDVQAEEVSEKKQKRTLDLYDRDLLSGQEAMESLHKNHLVNVDSEVLAGTREPISPLEMEQQNTDTASKAADQKPAAEKKNGLERLRAMILHDRRKAA